MTIKEDTYRTRTWNNEWFYSIVIDRFHDGKSRIASSNNGIGFGTAEELRQICGGKFCGITLKLPYLKSLGCTAILLTPFLENNPQVYHGYAIQDFLKVDERFGTLEDLQNLVAEAHALDMRVVMDVVLNHTGNNWSYKKTNTPYRKGKSYAFSHWHNDDKPQPAFFRNEKLYSKKGYILNWDDYPETWDGDLYELKDLVWTDDKKGHLLLNAMVDIYLYWVKTIGVDGFRLDALKHIRPPMAELFCLRIKEETTKMGFAHFLLLGEVVGDLNLINSYKGLDAYYNFPFYFKWNESLTIGNSMDAFSFEYTNDLLPLNFLDNHDQIGLEPKRRIAKVLSDEAILLHVFLMGLLPGISCLYYGTEQGLEDSGVKDHDIRSCMFDMYSDADLFNEKHDLYLKMKSTIAFVKSIKNAINRIEFVSLSETTQMIKCYNVNNECTYVMHYIEGAAMELENALPADALLFFISGKKSKDFQSTDFEFKVYNY